MPEHRTIPRIHFQWASAMDEGMTLELVEADEFGEVVENGLYPVARIVADDDENQWLELYPKEGIVRLRLVDVIEAINLSKRGVHGEKHYDQYEE